MKLHQTVLEIQGPVSVALTLNEIIRDGKVTNHYQVFTLARLSDFFKKGKKSIALHLEVPIDIESGATSTAAINLIKGMTPEQQVELAEYLLNCIHAGESALANPVSSVEDWMRFVLQAQR
jgi:hypothetical protein